MIGIRGTHAQHRMTAMTQLLFYVSIAAGINGVANGLAHNFHRYRTPTSFPHNV
jgi:hypothetical protein